MALIKFNQPKAFYGNDFMPLFDEVMNGIWGGSTENKVFNRGAAVNITEDEKEYHLEFAAPGFKKEEFSIKLEKNVLNVSAGRKEEQASEAKTFNRREFVSAPFSRSFTLPKTVNESEIKAEYKNGILFVNIPKKLEDKNETTRQIAVD